VPRQGQGLLQCSRNRLTHRFGAPQGLASAAPPPRVLMLPACCAPPRNEAAQVEARHGKTGTRSCPGPIKTQPLLARLSWIYLLLSYARQILPAHPAVVISPAVSQSVCLSVLRRSGHLNLDHSCKLHPVRLGTGRLQQHQHTRATQAQKIIPSAHLLGITTAASSPAASS
jgi:hypothetical protein